MPFGNASDQVIVAERKRHSQPTILIVEDNEVNLLVLQNLLKNYEYSLLIAKDGRKALDVFQKNIVDLILMDISMPIMDGFEATGKIREFEKENHIEPTPIIAVSAHVGPADQHLCITAGMNDYMPKPVTVDALHSTLQMWSPQIQEFSAA